MTDTTALVKGLSETKVNNMYMYIVHIVSLGCRSTPKMFKLLYVHV